MKKIILIFKENNILGAIFLLFGKRKSKKCMPQKFGAF